MRKIKLEYGLSNDKTELYVKCKISVDYAIESYEKDYNIKDFDNVSLYNKIIDDLNAEFDDVLSEMVDEMVCEVGGKLCDSVTQE